MARHDSRLLQKLEKQRAELFAARLTRAQLEANRERSTAARRDRERIRRDSQAREVVFKCCLGHLKGKMGMSIKESPPDTGTLRPLRLRWRLIPQPKSRRRTRGL